MTGRAPSEGVLTMRDIGRTITVWAAVIAILALLQPLNERLGRQRLLLGYAQPTTVTRVLQHDAPAMTGVVVGAMLGGFREVAASMIWMKTHELWHHGKGTAWDALSLMRIVTLLDPHWLEPWRITGWHCAYNLYVETDDPKQKADLLEMGVNVLKEGISWNPDRYDLYFELGWTFFDKIRDYEESTKWFEAAIQFRHPEYIERLIAHAYERIPEVDRALEWYDYCLKRRPNDQTAAGATITIRERYLPAWRLLRQHRYQEAIAEADKYLAVNPNGTIPLHLKAHIYEQAGDFDKAIQWWHTAGETMALDSYARAKVAQLCAELGRPAPREPSYFYRQAEEMAVRHELDAGP